MIDEKTAPNNPFSGLDKALLRSTQSQPVVPAQKPERSPVESSSETAPRKRAAPESTSPVTTSAPFDETATIESVQRALKAIGKETFYARVAPEEKRKIDQAVFALKQTGIRTSVNDIGRIALNYLMAEHEANGERSILSRVLASKRA